MCTSERRKLFTQSPVVDLLISELVCKAQSFDVEVSAYCFMPDHLHYLAEGLTDRADLMRFTRAFRQGSGYQLRRTGHERPWQEGYFDRHLRDEEATIDVVSYIVATPVRAGLCTSAHEYPFSGSSRYRLEDLVGSLE